MLLQRLTASESKLGKPSDTVNETWSTLVRRYRLRHGLSQDRLALVMGVSQRTISRWERGEDNPSVAQQKRLRDLGWGPSNPLFSSLMASVVHCPAPRALSCTPKLTLTALSGPALDKRPSMANWIGRDLAPIACGILQEMLDDRPLQRAIANGEIATVVSTTRSVLRTAEHDKIGLFRTTITYFFHEGALYHDAISFPALPTAVCGYSAVAMDEAFLGTNSETAASNFGSSEAGFDVAPPHVEDQR